MHLKSMVISERPREKMITSGAETLSSAELLAIVLQSGSREESSIQLGQRVLSMLDHGLEDLSHITIEELMKLRGIGQAKACQIISAVELGKRISKQKRQMLGKVNSPSTVVEFFKEALKHANKEQFIVVFLNTKNIITSYEVISIGTLSASIVHPREVYNRAIKKSAASIILVHNHPSGNPEPSREDRQITSRLKEVGEVVGIKVLDHLIVTDEHYFSFKEMDIL